MSNVKKLLSDERRRSNSDGQKITETQVLFAQVLKDYNSSTENVRQLYQEKRAKVHISHFTKYIRLYTMIIGPPFLHISDLITIFLAKH